MPNDWENTVGFLTEYRASLGTKIWTFRVTHPGASRFTLPDDCGMVIRVQIPKSQSDVPKLSNRLSRNRGVTLGYLIDGDELVVLSPGIFTFAALYEVDWEWETEPDDAG